MVPHLVKQPHTCRGVHTLGSTVVLHEPCTLAGTSLCALAFISRVPVTKPTCQSRTGVRTRDLILSASCFCIQRRCTHAGTHVSPSRCCLFILRRADMQATITLFRAPFISLMNTLMSRTGTIQVTFLEN